MKQLCARGRHQAGSGAVRNQGLEFGRCLHCRHDLVRSGRSWRAVPEGFRVVWRSEAPEPGDSAAGQLLLDLPPIGRQLAFYDRPRPRAALLVALELALLGLRGIGEALALRVRAWLEALDGPEGVPAVIPRLPAR